MQGTARAARNKIIGCDNGKVPGPDPNSRSKLTCIKSKVAMSVPIAQRGAEALLPIHMLIIFRCCLILILLLCFLSCRNEGQIAGVSSFTGNPVLVIQAKALSSSD